MHEMAAMTHEEMPLKIELTSLADDPRYIVKSELEIAHTLRAMMRRGELLAAYFGSDNEFIITTILAVQPENKTLILDYGSDSAASRRLLASGDLICVGSHDKVRVQFTAHQVAEDSLEGRPAFKLRLPETMLKLQRREYYRLIAPTGMPVTCTISAAGGKRVALNVFDISIGGICTVGHPQDIDLKLGAIYQGCSINLPEIGTVIANLEVRNAFDITLKSNAKTRRCGCMFLNMPASAQTLIQKYIIKMERERRQRHEDG